MMSEKEFLGRFSVATWLEYTHYQEAVEAGYIPESWRGECLKCYTDSRTIHFTYQCWESDGTQHLVAAGLYCVGCVARNRKNSCVVAMDVQGRAQAQESVVKETIKECLSYAQPVMEEILDNFRVEGWRLQPEWQKWQRNTPRGNTTLTTPTPQPVEPPVEAPEPELDPTLAAYAETLEISECSADAESTAAGAQTTTLLTRQRCAARE